ncbi:MAG: nitroreductase family protein [Spirochaetales bacterium]|nr:nitroreductase family protein [Spirochaetales bacterium]
MDYYKLISGRESIRSFDPDRKISEKTLRNILDAGRLAPSACNNQPWEFILVSSEQMLKKIRPCYSAAWFQDAPHILIVKGFRDRAWRRSFDDYNSLETDLTIAMDHMILAAESEGIGTCWIAAFSPKMLKEALNMKTNEEVFAITPLGYTPAEFLKKGNKGRKPFDEVVKYI